MFWDPNKKEKTMKRAGASASAFVWVEGIKMVLEGRSAKNQSELPQKAKVKCHKKPKLCRIITTGITWRQTGCCIWVTEDMLNVYRLVLGKNLLLCRGFFVLLQRQT
jgi:hypothetical protein